MHEKEILELGQIGLKILWSLTVPVVSIIGYFLRQSGKRAADQVNDLVKADKELHDRITQAVRQLEHLQGEHDALWDNHGRRKNPR